jgi:hypothetical protein
LRVANSVWNRREVFLHASFVNCTADNDLSRTNPIPYIV